MNEYEKFDGVPNECLAATDSLATIVLALILVGVAIGVVVLSLGECL